MNFHFIIKSVNFRQNDLIFVRFLDIDGYGLGLLLLLFFQFCLDYPQRLVIDQILFLYRVFVKHAHFPFSILVPWIFFFFRICAYTYNFITRFLFRLTRYIFPSSLLSPYFLLFESIFQHFKLNANLMGC